MRTDRDELQRQFRATTYRVYYSGAAIDLKIGQPSPLLDLRLQRCGKLMWALVSAGNPGAVAISETKNHRRHALLTAAASKRYVLIYQALAIAARGTWPPESMLWLPGLHCEAALELARTFEQLAIVAGQRWGLPTLVWC
jgi:hypothetical protein